MKRYVCTVVASMLLALAGAGAATAGLPVLSDQQGTQSTSFGDQSVGKQKNDADVSQAQGNGNVNISPAISIFGDSSTSNKQGNGNTAVAVVDQSNSASQSQSADQQQWLSQGGSSGGCCGGSTQAGEQRVYGGDQSVGEQKNDADVTQKQGNGNVNVSPAVSVFGDASTSNSQGNGNTAIAKVDQSNEATQSQSSSQDQSLTQGGGSCCGGQSQTGAQTASFGDQSIGKQRNDADVTQSQGNGNVNISPAIAVWGDASTWNAQGNGNTAIAKVDQSNEATQSQSSSQDQSLTQGGGSCCKGQSQTGKQKTYFGDQWIGEQRNDADVTQKQGNHNLNVAPAVAIWGDASTWNAQGNGNKAVAKVYQSNEAAQSQSATQEQDLSQQGGGCCRSSSNGYGKSSKKDCCRGSSQTGEQKTSFGDQSIGKQHNDADVTQKQGNGNVNFAPAVAFPHVKREPCSQEKHGGGYGKCGESYTPDNGRASTWNAQGNGNFAFAWVGQSNEADQSQSSSQTQSLVQGCCDTVNRS